MNEIELKNKLDLYGIKSDQSQIDLLLSYMHYILDKNKEINLTAIDDESTYIDKMIFDSALPLALLDFNGKKVLDIGTGGGYPGTVIATLSSADVDLLDSTNKKLEVINCFKEKKFNTINARIEDYARVHREQYDIVIARAVSALPILIELALPLVKVGGFFIAMKGKDGEVELENSKNALKKLNAHVAEIHIDDLPMGDKRINILIKKDKSCNNKYPRDYASIKHKPL